MDEDLQKWLNGQIDDDQLQQRLGHEEAKKYIQIVEEVDAWIPDHSKQLVNPTTITSRAKSKSRSIRPYISYATAAVLILTVITYLWLLLGGSEVSYSSAIGEVRVVNLPDGLSTVTLSSDSEISWDKDEWQQVIAAKEKRLSKSPKRKVKLKGKALFKIEKGGPFSVESESGLVEVLGTTFEIDDFLDGLNVVCFEGKVAAKPKTARKRIVISGGEGYRYFQNRWEEKRRITQPLPDWLQNQTKFDNAPLSQVILTLEKLYGVSIDKSGVDINKRFTGTIPNDNLDVSLKIVFTPYEISFLKKGKKIILSKDE